MFNEAAIWVSIGNKILLSRDDHLVSYPTESVAGSPENSSGNSLVTSSPTSPEGSPQISHVTSPESKPATLPIRTSKNTSATLEEPIPWRR